MSYPREITNHERRHLLMDAVEQAMKAAKMFGRPLDLTDIDALVNALIERGVRRTPKLTRFSLGEWSALYEDGELYDNVGDTYLSEERIGEWVDVEDYDATGDDAPFRRADGGGVYRDSIPKTLDEVNRRRAHATERKAEAEKLRQRAQELLEQAKELDP